VCVVVYAGGTLVCCDTCPAAFHASCLRAPPAEGTSWECEECTDGRRPAYGEIVWAKYAGYRQADVCVVLMSSLQKKTQLHSYYTLCPEKSPPFYFLITLSKINRF